MKRYYTLIVVFTLLMAALVLHLVGRSRVEVLV